MKFKVGDVVRPKRTNYFVSKHETYVVEARGEGVDGAMLVLENVPQAHCEWFFELEAIITSPLYQALK